MKNLQASHFVDKCTARLHFERQGVKLYEVVLTKCPKPLVPRFQKILRDEQRHVALLEQVLHGLGANPYALTPSAKVIELEARGFERSIRKSDFEGLMDTLLSIELTDTASWELLVLMAKKLGRRDLQSSFEKALVAETTHLKFIHRHILKELTGSARLLEFGKRRAKAA